MNKKVDLLIIGIIFLAISLFSIILFNLKFGPIKIGQQSIRFMITLILSCYLYQEKQWARWIFVVLSFIAGLASLIRIVVLDGPIYLRNTIILIPLSLFYIIAAVYLAFIREWRA